MTISIETLAQREVLVCVSELISWALAGGDREASIDAFLPSYLSEEEDNADGYFPESFEWWAVSDWLAEKLKAHCETVAEYRGLNVWGRTTTGQAISSDYVIEQIYKELKG